MKIQKKYQGAIPLNRIANEHNESELNTYSTQYLNSKFCAISPTQPTNGEEVWIQTGKNLFDKNNVVVGWLNEDGSINYEITYRTTNFIPVETGGQYSKTATGSARFKFFDKDKKPLSTQYNDIADADHEIAFIVPDNAKYIRFSMTVDYINSVQLERGNSATEYEQYIDKDVYFRDEMGNYKSLLGDRTHVGPYAPEDGEAIWIKTSTNFLNTSPELSITLSTDIACHLKKGIYTLAIDSATSTGGSYESYVGFKNAKGETFLYTYIHYGTKYITFTLEQDVKEIAIWSQKYWDISKGVTTTFKNMRIVKGSKSLPYEPYTYGQILAQDAGGDYKEIYSKENFVSYLKSEQQIGTWIDNKPLYRRVYTGTITKNGGALFNLPNINTHKAYGTIYLPTEYVTHPIGGYAYTTHYCLECQNICPFNTIKS